MNHRDRLILSSALLALIIGINSYLIISEASGYFRECLGKSGPESVAFAFAACMGAIALVMHSVRGMWAGAGQVLLIIAIEAGLIFASAMHVAKPIVAADLTGPQQALRVGYETRLTTIRAELSRLADTARAFGRQNPKNLAMTETRRARLRAQEAEVSGKLEGLLESAAERQVSGFEAAEIGHVIFWRLCLGLLNLSLALPLRHQFSLMLQLSGHHAEQGQDREAPISAAAEGQAHSPQHAAAPAIPQQIATQTPADAPQTARDFVQTLYPNARCTSEGRGRKGPFIIYGDETDKIFLGKGGNNLPDGAAWGNAALKIRRAA